MASTVWRGYITFGLISIPVRLLRAARPGRVSFRRLYRETPAPSSEQREPVPQAGREPPPSRFVSGSRNTGVASQPAPEHAHSEGRVEPILKPIQQVSVSEGSEEVVPAASVVKGYEYEKGRFVEIPPEELKSAASKTSTEMEIQEFVQLTEIDPVYFETSYYVNPEEAGEKAYALLYRSLQLTALVAIAKFAMHSREHVVVVRPGKTGLLAHTMFFASEVRANEEYRADITSVTSKELDLAQALIHSLAAPFEPEKYRDTYREKLESIIAAKVRGQPAAPTDTIPKKAGVVDIAEALRKSLANLKKPVSSEQQPRKPARARQARNKSHA